MTVKLEVIIIESEETQGCVASTCLACSNSGYTQHEADLAAWLDNTVNELFRAKFKSTQFAIQSTKENTNVH